MVDASLFSQPFQGGMGPPANPKDYQDRYRQWMEILQNPQTQQYLHESGLARGLISFGSRLAQSMGTGNPFMASLGNAVEAGVGTYDDMQRSALEGAMQLAKGQQGAYEGSLDYWNEQARLSLEAQKNQMLAPVYQEQAGMYGRSNRGEIAPSGEDQFKMAASREKQASELAAALFPLPSEMDPEYYTKSERIMALRQAAVEYMRVTGRPLTDAQDPNFQAWGRSKRAAVEPSAEEEPANKGVPLATRARQVGSALSDVFNQVRPRGGVLPGQPVTEGAFGGLTRNVAAGARQTADTLERVTNPPREQAVVDDVGRAIGRLKRDPGGYASTEDWHYIIQNMDKLQKEPHISNGDLEWFRNNVPPSMLASTTRVPKNRQYR